MSEWSYSQRQCTLGSKSGKHSWIIKLNNLDQLLAILWKIEVQSDAHLRPSYCESDGGGQLENLETEPSPLRLFYPVNEGSLLADPTRKIVPTTML